MTDYVDEAHRARSQIISEASRRVVNFGAYGTTHPELLKPHGMRLADLHQSDIDGLQIKVEYPPNIDAIDKVFRGVKRDCTRRQIIFTYGLVIYNPSAQPIGLELLAHEAVHTRQQKNPGAWWDRYLKDKQFRFDQELEAHCVEFEQRALMEPGRHARRRYLAMTAERLAGPLYGNLMKKKAAQAIIKARVWNVEDADGDAN